VKFADVLLLGFDGFDVIVAVGAVLSIVIELEVPVPVDTAAPEFWSEPLAEPEKVSVPSPLTGPHV
jgi:hypothetical protein